MKVKRKKFLVEKQAQGALGYRIVAHWLVFLGVSLMITTLMRVIGNLEQENTWQSFTNAILGQAGSIVVLLALLPWFVHDSLKLSNRFAGPMVRLQKSIKELANGNDVPPVVFRKGDFWGEIATDFNQLRSRVLADRERLSEATAQREERSNIPAIPVANSILPVNSYGYETFS